MSSGIDQIAALRRMLVRPDIQMAGAEVRRDIIRRRIFALQHEIIFTNPFTPVDETLYRIGGRS